MPPPGAHLSVDELIAALKWKLEDEDDGSNTIEMGGPSDLRWASLASTWLQRLGELQHITNLVASRQNAAVGVNLLPTEILSKIFLQLQAEYSNKSFCLPPENQDLTGTNEWIKVTHVCRIWRRCAHNTKVLWCRIIFGPSHPSPSSMATHFFHLSHPLPISLEQALERDPDGLGVFWMAVSWTEERQINKFYDLLLEHPNRISALYLRGYFPEPTWGLLQKSLPNLVELQLSFENAEDPMCDEKSPMMSGYIANFLGGSPTSTLRKLSLDNYTWPGLTPPALTHLYLTDHYHVVGLADFFSMLASLSSTLRILYLKGAGPEVLNLDEYDSLSITERLVMPALEHFETLSSEFRDTANPLLHLYRLSLPNIHTIIWEYQWTADLRTYTDAHKRTTMIPPNEYLARVTRLVGWAAREDCYALQGETLYFDPSRVAASLLDMLARLLPNLVMLASPGYVKCMDDAIRHSTTLRHLSIGEASNYSVLVYTLEEASHTDCLPYLEVLTIYYRSTHDDFLSKLQQNFVSMKLKPLGEPLIDNSVTRARYHLQTTYALRFDITTTRGFFLSDPSL
ncbi:hypothetical protein GALMADRAFT_258621 [Galerina marginata CBS 339.88]|uniref:F-box domain-containing protein n=1 Tax=Galerina marginata (strain CBS 339.88) TaxID=685588 RepID=A0A067S840_GALM3|nr:hypothetical protein GALMADRAFT_258621 [Galerina marginata CBS 339.88]